MKISSEVSWYKHSSKNKIVLAHPISSTHYLLITVNKDFDRIQQDKS